MKVSLILESHGGVKKGNINFNIEITTLGNDYHCIFLALLAVINEPHSSEDEKIGASFVRRLPPGSGSSMGSRSFKEFVNSR